MFRVPVLLAVLTIALAGCAAPAAEQDLSAVAGSPKEIVLAIQPTDNAMAIQEKAAEMESFLEARMREDGVEADVKIIVPLTYIGAVEALRYEHADAAMMSAWPMSLAATKGGAEVVLAEMREVVIGTEAQVAPYYYSYYVVKKDSPYQTLEDVRGKRVAYPSASSTSGYIFPLAKLVEDGLVTTEAGKEADPAAFFSQVAFAGGYAQAWEALKGDQVDVTVTAGDINAKLYAEILDNTRIVATQGPVPSHGVVFGAHFKDTPEAEALKNALLDLKDDKRDLMRKLVSGIFVRFEPTTTQEHVAGLTGALETTGIRFSEKLG